MPGKLGTHLEKYKIRPPHTRINSKWIRNLDVKNETIDELLKENINELFFKLSNSKNLEIILKID